MSAPDRQQFEQNVRVAGRVGVLMGGRSGEREVSLKSGAAVTAALRSAGVDATALDWAGTLDSLLSFKGYDRYFIALHGRGGEDGQVQAALELLGVPYTGTGVAGCAIAMDKYRSKLAWLGAGLPTPDFRLLDASSDVHSVIAELGLPFIVKPAREGSSLGVSKVTLADDFGTALTAALAYDELVLAERYIAGGGEYTLAVVAGQTLPMIRLETPHEFYDYAAKYLVDTTSYICPCGLSAAEEAAAAALGLRAFEALDGRGWGRVDFMRDAQGRMWLIELNTVPGMTDHSLVPMAARQAGWSFEQLVIAILASSRAREVSP
jgi:D-alanine-D-alanine ligase